MIVWVNKYKKAVQALVTVFGLAFVFVLLNSALARGVGPNVSERFMKRAFMSISKPAEIGIYALVGLYAVRATLKWWPAKDLGRTLFRVLQVIHIPLAVVVLAAATLHGGLFVLYLWRSDFHYWSGVVALVGMLAVSGLGMVTYWKRKSKAVHMSTALIIFGLVLIHIFTA